jgi:hypothetical protein
MGGDQARDGGEHAGELTIGLMLKGGWGFSWGLMTSGFGSRDLGKHGVLHGFTIQIRRPAGVFYGCSSDTSLAQLSLGSG